MTLVSDLKLLIFTYLPLKSVQLLNEQGLVVLDNTNFLTKLLKNKYNLTNIDLINTDLLNTFDQFTKYSMFSGDIGYCGQFYLSPLIYLAYAIRSRDNNLFNYYFLRFINTNNWPLTQLSFIESNAESFPRPYMPILCTLAMEYNRDVYDVLYNFFSKFNKARPMNFEVKNMTDALAFIEPDKVELYINDDNSIINVNSYDVLQAIKYYSNGLITKKYIANAKVMRQKVLNLLPQFSSRDQYLDVLSILLNNDINIEPYIDNEHFLDSIIILAFAVLNIKVLRKLYKQELIKHDYSEIPVSEVVYDVNQSYNYDTTAIISIYLANRANELKQEIPLVKTLNNIVKTDYKGGTKGAIADNAYILDPETGVKLEQYEINKYLHPITQFDYDLMVKFGFNPPYKQLE